MPRIPSPLAASGFALALLLTACGTFTLDDPSTPNSVSRRLYVNDRAANDSLTPALVLDGIKFVLQPGRDYQLTLESTPRTTDKLSVYYFNDGTASLYKSLTASSDGTQEVFGFASDQSSAQFFMAQLESPEGSRVIPSLHRILLTSASTLSADTLHVRLLYVRTLRTLPDSASKAAFAKNLFTEMGKIYTPFGITLVGTFDIVEPAAAALVFPFSNTYVALPGNRVLNNAHLYMVDSISIGDPNAGLDGQVVLGFAPREVVDLDTHRESRVLLSSRALYGLSSQEAARSLAITATHELGHFFGLRHTVSTRNDLLQDNDFSNVEDGFTDTRFCQLDIALPKSASYTERWIESTHSPYCLRVRRVLDNSCSDKACEITNLMYPVDCGAENQINMSAQQIAFLKKNLATYKH